MSAFNFETRWANSNDTHELLALFNDCFDTSMTHNIWEWKYRYAESPGIICLHNNAIIAFCGGIPRLCHWGNSTFMSVQLGDVMVKPNYRALLTRQGPLYKVVRTYANYIGKDKQFEHAFGFPNNRHYRLGELLSLYCKTDVIYQAEWEVLPQHFFRYKTRLLDARDAPAAERLWQRMRKSLPNYVVGERNWQWLNHRYNPKLNRNYQLWLITDRLTYSAVGICVLRIHPDSVELLDIIGPENKLCVVVKIAQNLTASSDKKKLVAWLSPSVARSLESTNPTLKNIGVIVPGNSTNQGLDHSMTIASKWWLMGGDSDFR